MPYDDKVPQLLKRSQQWFASIITQPIDATSRINPKSPRGNSIVEEAKEFIAPSPTLKPHQRIELYNQQYWWRLLGVLHDVFPMVVRLFGYEDFNQTIGIPFLQKHPPDHWSLNHLGSKLPEWLERYYQADDKTLVMDAAKLDWSFQDSFLCKELPAYQLTGQTEEVEGFIHETIYLQPHLQLFQMNYNLPVFREQFLKQDPEYWVNHDFPELIHQNNFTFVVYRTLKNDIFWKAISHAEYLLLEKLQKGTTIDALSEWLETTESSIQEESLSKLAEWFQEWTIRQWLTKNDYRNSQRS